MAETKIEWTATALPDGTLLPGFTFNPWHGCQKVSDGCKFCYADAQDRRFGKSHWGPTAPRRIFAAAHWREPLRWNADAQSAGVRRKVFCASMADVFERLPLGHPSVNTMADDRLRLWDLIEATPWLDWLLLTKRPENVLAMVPTNWTRAGASSWPENVWIGTSVEDQAAADTRIPLLLKIPAPVRFLSCEPLLGPVDLMRVGMRDKPDGVSYGLDVLNGCAWACSDQGECGDDCPSIQWVIVGGESGIGARPMHPDWVRTLRDQCQAAGVPFFFKQHGEWIEVLEADAKPGDQYLLIRDGAPWGWPYAWHPDDPPMHGAEAGRYSPWRDVLLRRVGKKNAGRLQDGCEWSEFPLRAQQLMTAQKAEVL